jgi:hypothetical protein
MEENHFHLGKLGVISTRSQPFDEEAVVYYVIYTTGAVSGAAMLHTLRQVDRTLEPGDAVCVVWHFSRSLIGCIKNAFSPSTAVVSIADLALLNLPIESQPQNS